jgi:hypothetical protein
MALITVPLADWAAVESSVNQTVPSGLCSIVVVYVPSVLEATFDSIINSTAWFGRAFVEERVVVSDTIDWEESNNW